MRDFTLRFTRSNRAFGVAVLDRRGFLLDRTRSRVGRVSFVFRSKESHYCRVMPRSGILILKLWYRPADSASDRARL